MYVCLSIFDFLTHSQVLGPKKTETPDIQTSPEQRCGPPRHRPRLFGCLGNRGFLRPKHSRSHSWLITVSHHPILGDFPKPVQWWGGTVKLKEGAGYASEQWLVLPWGWLRKRDSFWLIVPITWIMNLLFCFYRFMSIYYTWCYLM